MKTTIAGQNTIIFLLILLCSCSGERWSEEWEEKFESFQPSGKIMDVIGVRPGMTIGEIGAGNGRFAVKVADRVGPEGFVYANDIDEDAVDSMEKRCIMENITNMTVIHSGEVDPGFPAAELDLVYIINTYDHLSDPVNLMKNTAPSLKPSGRLAIIATDTEKLEDHGGHATPREVVLEQAADAGFVFVAIDTTFQYDNVYLFRWAGTQKPEPEKAKNLNCGNCPMKCDQGGK